MRYLLAWLIGGYQKISRLTPAVCRFYPTCSAYAKTALLRYGVLRGGFLAVRRLLCVGDAKHRCSKPPSGSSRLPSQRKLLLTFCRRTGMLVLSVCHTALHL